MVKMLVVLRCILKATALPIIARLPRLLTLVITDLAVFKVCIKRCSQSQNPLVRDLVKRIVYEKFEFGLFGWRHYF